MRGYGIFCSEGLKAVEYQERPTHPQKGVRVHTAIPGYKRGCMRYGRSGALFSRRAHQRKEVYPVKIPVIRHEVVDVVPACRRGMQGIREQ